MLRGENHTAQPNQEELKAKPPHLSLTLRLINIFDIDDIMIWASNDRVMRIHPQGPCTTKAQALDLINNYVLPHPWYRAICVDGQPVGSIGVKPAVAPGDEHGDRASIGYGLAYDYWGRGITTEAVKTAVTSVLKECPQLERIEAMVEVENRGAQRVLEKAGFLREGVLRKYVMLRGESIDVIMYSFISEET